MRLFNIHKLSFETAGQSGVGALVSLLGVVEAEHFREMILEQKEALSSNTPVSRKQEAEPAAAPTDLTTLTESVQRIEALLSQLVDTKKRVE